MVSGSINIQNNELKKQIEVNIVQTFCIPKIETIIGYILIIENIKMNPHVCTTPVIVPKINYKILKLNTKCVLTVKRKKAINNKYAYTKLIKNDYVSVQLNT